MLNAFYLYQIFALGYVVVKTHKSLARMESSELLQCAIREKRSIIVRAQEK